MNIDKRYYQNRQRKRKRTILPSPIDEGNKNVSPSEDERKFKMKRFMEGVGKFLSEKENHSDQGVSLKTKMKTTPAARMAVKQVNIPKQMKIHGRGMQTKICKRGGVMTREMTAKLDEDLYKIISLNKNIQCNQQCQCIQGKTGFTSPNHGMQLRSRTTSILKPLLPRPSPSEDLPHFRSPQSELVGGKGEPPPSSDEKSRKSLSELDKELYPRFARVVSVSCTQTKSALFKNQSYVSAVKRKLIDIYVKGMREEKQERGCLKELQKATSSVGTSPFSSPLGTQFSNPRKERPFKFAPVKVHFKSTMQFLEETIGPSSTCSSKPLVPSPHFHQHLQCRQPPPSLLSPPVVGYQRPQRVSTYVPRASRYVHEPLVMSPSPTANLFGLKPKIFDGGGDGLHFNCCDNFLPSIEEEEVEDSPDFRYFPRKIF